MTKTTLRRPGRPRKAEPTVEQATPVVEQAEPAQEPTLVQEQPQQAQYVIAKLTPHMLAGEIQRLYQEGEDLSPVHMVSDAIRADAEPVSAATHAQPHEELKAAIDAAKTSLDRPRSIAVAYRNHRGAVKVAHGTQLSDGGVYVESGHSSISGYERSLESLKETIGSREHYIDYTDEP